MLRTLASRSVTVLSTALLLIGCTNTTPQKSENGQAGKVAPVAKERPGVPRSGEALFKQYCSPCHPDGGNVSDASRPLYGSVLRSNHITTPEDIVRIMRNPLSRMIRFDVSTLSDQDARAIAEYILATFNH
ncbi:MAG: cytochrome c [Geobacteraceae bacterium]|nr:cytochrome c [Geobacteraceae bacterium]